MRRLFLVDLRAVVGQVVGGLAVVADVRLVAQEMEPVLIVVADGNDGEEVFALAGGLDLVGAVAVDHVKAVRGHALNGLALQKGHGVRAVGIMLFVHKLTSELLCAKKQRTPIGCAEKYWINQLSR